MRNKLIIFKLALRLESSNLNSYFPSMRDHLENCVEQLNADIKHIEKEFNKIAEEFPENYYEISEEYQETMSYYKVTYPEITYNSSFLVAYSLFEKSLKNIRATVEKYIIDKKGNASNSRNYIIKHRDSIANFTSISSIAFNSKLWNKINKVYRVLRNCIAHDNNSLKGNNSTIPNYKLDAYNFVKNNSSFELNEDNGEFKIISSLFIINLLEDLKKYLESVIKELNENSNINFK